MHFCPHIWGMNSGRIVSWIHGITSIHTFSTSTPFHQKKWNVMTWFLFPTKIVQPMDWLVDCWFSLVAWLPRSCHEPEEWWIRVAWCLSCLTHSIAVTRWLQRPLFRQKRVVERWSQGNTGGFEVDERQGCSRVFLGVKEWIDKFHTCIAYEARGCTCCSRQVVVFQGDVLGSDRVKSHSLAGVPSIHQLELIWSIQHLIKKLSNNAFILL